ncbi:MAG: hypothetical protein AMXMBFR57_01430 [Acidimicrobiia bacterium]
MSRLIKVVITASLSLLVPATVASAQVTHSSKAWIDVSFGVASAAEKTRSTSISISDGAGEFEDYRTTYNIPRGAAADFGAGYMFTDLLGAGIAFNGAAHKDPADLSIRIPHPNFFNRHATDEGETDEGLERTEGSVHFKFVVRPVHTDRVSFRVFAGPSYYRMTMDAVSEIRYLQAFIGSLNAVEITSYDSVEAEATGWGFHGGADLSYFFTNSFGLGIGAQISRGTVTLDDYQILSDAPVDFKVGGFQAFGGLRFRF